jgi:peptidoglycan/LPS O-acetylase OafA/YrhL
VPVGDGPYTPGWRRYRNLSRAFWLVFLLYIPVIGGVSRALRSSQDNATVIAVAAFAALILFATLGYQTFNLRCPRCGEAFSRRFDDRPWRMDWQHRPFTRRCLHCGLPKWADRDPAQSQSPAAQRKPHHP